MEPIEQNFIRKHRTALIISGAALIVIAGAAAGAVAIGHSIDHSVAQIGAAVASTKPAATKAPAVKATPAAPVFNPATVKVGDTVPQHAQLPDGFYKFPMADGTTVAVNQAQPLPAAVHDALVAQAKTTIVPTPDRTQSQKDLAALSPYADQAFAYTGKYTVVVTQLVAATGPNQPEVLRWVAMSDQWNPGTTADTEAGVVAAAQARIASLPDAARYEIVVLP